MSTIPRPTSTTPLLGNVSTSPTKPNKQRSRRSSHSRRTKNGPHIQVIPAILLCTLLVLASFAIWDVSPVGNCYFRPLCRLLGDDKNKNDSIWWRNAGAYAPWRAVGTSGGQRGLPKGCELNQVTILQRHTARYPTTSAAKDLRAALDKVANRGIMLPRRHTELSFLAKADLNLKTWRFDELTDPGRFQAFRSGEAAKKTYGSFIHSGAKLFTRSSGAGRVVETAEFWLRGFNAERFRLPRDGDRAPVIDVVIPEGEASNNTLSVHSCPAFQNARGVPDPGSVELKETVVFLQPTIDRLNVLLQPPEPFTPDDVLQLMSMCAFDSQVRGLDWAGWSSWCAVFRQDEWEIKGYMREVERFYQVGEGSRYGPSMGVGYINELLARLQDNTVGPSPNVNRTLDDHERTFPRGGKRIFVDFAHDNEQIEILTALGALKQHRLLSTVELPEKRTFPMSELIPFGSSIAFERISCDLAGWEPDPGLVEAPEEPDGRFEYVRILVNGKIYRIGHLACQQSNFAEHGLCDLESFVETQEYAVSGGNWIARCYEDSSP